ncbi:MAG: hypothetical protein SGARI_002645 [Bacillariaceae sp.]
MSVEESSINNGLLDTGAAIQPFLDILKDDQSLNVSTLRSLVAKVLAHPKIFCGFDQFKGACLSSNLLGGGTIGTTIANTLDLFSYGGLKEYTLKQQEQGSSEYYLPLNEAALSKLGQLTVLTSIQDACFHGAVRISYSALAESLGWITPNQAQANDDWIRNIEDLLIKCLYAQVLKGKLCQKTRSFGWETESLPMVSTRDVPPQQLADLLAALKGLEGRLETSEKDASQAQSQVAQNLVDANKLISTMKEKQKQAQSDSKKMGGLGGASRKQQGFSFGGGMAGFFAARAGGEEDQALHIPTRPGGARSSKRSRGGGSFATDTTFRM